MKHGPEPNAAIMAGRMHPLPRRLRIAHLRALIRQQPAGSIRGEQLAAALRGEMAAQPRHRINPPSPSAPSWPPMSPGGRRNRRTT